MFLAGRGNCDVSKLLTGLLCGLDVIFSPLFSHMSFGFVTAPSTVSVTDWLDWFFSKCFANTVTIHFFFFFVNVAAGWGSKSCCGPGDVYVFLWKLKKNQEKIAKSCNVCLMSFLVSVWGFLLVSCWMFDVWRPWLFHGNWYHLVSLGLVSVVSDFTGSQHIKLWIVQTNRIASWHLVQCTGSSLGNKAEKVSPLLFL